ncbi:apolipoprotein D [Procambarus clarkii]|uniref:apolipoprotein D n=1 Tax=Procambarus clarkii TaxID=6728 RepID=UPI001E673E79|nr:crustacyanin-A2 subunit-like [Procambarus clarkii]
MMFLVVVVVVAVAGAGGTGAAPVPEFSHILNGTCLNPRTQPSLNYQKFSGRWVEAASKPNLFRTARQCATVHFTVTDESVRRVTAGVDGREKASSVTTLLHPQHDPATFSISYFGLPVGSVSVLDTDYTSTACVYQCQQATPTHKVEGVYVYARDLRDAATARRRCKKVFASQGLDVASIVPSPHPYHTCAAAAL